MTVRILHGDALEQMRTLADESVHSIVTDPPYELGFMGKVWDGTGIANSVDLWTACLRVLKPGGHLLSFGGSRTYHRMACAIEDAGFEIRDQIMWVYGSGFPKSLDVSKAIDKARDDRIDILRVTSFMADAAERASITRGDVDAAMGTSDMGGWWLSRLVHRCQCPKWDQWLQLKVLLSLTDEMDAEVWRLNGRKGTPGEAWAEREFYDEPTGGLHGGTGNTVGAWGLGRQAKPEGVTESARQWQGWGTALKPAHEPIVVARKPLIGTVAANVLKHGTGAINVDGCRVEGAPESPGTTPPTANGNGVTHGGMTRTPYLAPLGRWPANLIHDGSDEVLAGFPSVDGPWGQGKSVSTTPSWKQSSAERETDNGRFHGETGSAARFFYTAKAAADDRNTGSHSADERNHHPTVKPTDLMQYLVRLVTPPGGTVLDPFAGSGSTGLAADREGFDAILIERDAEYVEIARRRIVGDCPLFAELAA